MLLNGVIRWNVYIGLRDALTRQFMRATHVINNIYKLISFFKLILYLSGLVMILNSILKSVLAL